ncbi:MAG TPA: hypothetical protein DEH78_29055 [Solibacterales bacterium]|nr:hypothetical protein [Bryobacterales bacterium]
MKKPAPPRWTLAWWKSEWWKSWFREPDDDAPACAVCIPPGAKLLLSELPLPLQRELGVSANETVRFVQMDADEYSYRDAVRFSNGRRILLQALRPGQAVRVLSLACEEREARSGALSSNTLVEAR